MPKNWLIWIVVDVIAIGVYSARELYPTVGLYGVFLLLCIPGLYHWKHSSAGYSLGGVKSAM